MQVKVEELTAGSKLSPFYHGSADASMASLSIIQASYNVPTRMPGLFGGPCFAEHNTHDVYAVKVARKYVYLTMGTRAIVKREKGTLVEVARLGPEEPQDAALAVLETPEPGPEKFCDPECDSYLSDDATGESYLCNCGANPPKRQPFSYAARELGRLGSLESSKAKFATDQGETRWMSIHPGDMAEIAEILIRRERGE